MKYRRAPRRAVSIGLGIVLAMTGIVPVAAADIGAPQFSVSSNSGRAGLTIEVSQVTPCPVETTDEYVQVSFTDAAGVVTTNNPGSALTTSGNWNGSIPLSIPWRQISTFDPLVYTADAAPGVGSLSVQCYTVSGGLQVTQQYESQPFTVTGPSLSLALSTGTVQPGSIVHVSSVDPCPTPVSSVSGEIGNSAAFVQFSPAPDPSTGAWSADVTIPTTITGPMGGTSSPFPLGSYRVTVFCNSPGSPSPGSSYGEALLVVGAPPPPPQCADVAFIAAAGSDEHFTTDDDISISPELKKAHDAFHAVLRGRRTDVIKMVDYPALSVSVLYQNFSTIGNIPATFEQNINEYLDGKDFGVESIRESFANARSNCPHEAIVLAGYSQGAMVVHQFLEELDLTNDPGKAAIEGVILLADPDRVSNSQVFDFGTAPSSSNGICQELSLLVNCVTPDTLTDIPATFRPATVGVCQSLDPVCDTTDFFTLSTIFQHIDLVKLGTSIHNSYRYIPQTTSAGQRTARLVLAHH